MTNANLLFFLYGVAVMFFFMMSFIFMYRQSTRLKRIVGVLLLIIGLLYVKDLPFICTTYYADVPLNHTLSCLDSLVVPLYVLVLVEACRPRWLTLWRSLAIVAPFMAVTIAYICSRQEWMFMAVLAFISIYGIGCGVWVLHELPVYHHRLREEFSYEDDINLHWLRGIMALFFVILTIWVADKVEVNLVFDIIYIVGMMVLWAVTCFFFYRQGLVLHEVIDRCDDEADIVSAAGAEPLVGALAAAEEPNVSGTCVATDNVAAATDSDVVTTTTARFAALEKRLKRLFDEERVFLDPHLRLSELARRLGTNRTYLSQYFNQCLSTTFYDYVNDRRITYAKHLLHTTDYTLEMVAAAAGFNSISTFRRAFQQRVGCSAMEYRGSK